MMVDVREKQTHGQFFFCEVELIIDEVFFADKLLRFSVETSVKHFEDLS